MEKQMIEIIYYENPHNQNIAFSVDYGTTIIIPNGKKLYLSEGSVWEEVVGDYDEYLTEIQKDLLDQAQKEYLKEKTPYEEQIDKFRLGRLKQAYENKPVPRR
jgi:hypothetical protein